MRFAEHVQGALEPPVEVAARQHLGEIAGVRVRQLELELELGLGLG